MSEFWGRAIQDTKRGEIKDGETRYVMLRADVIAAMVNQLAEETRGEVLRSFASAVESYGGKSLARYFDMVDRDADALLATVAATAPDLGWGAWQFQLGENELILEVINSPYAVFNAPAGASCCSPILGMFTALAKMILGGVTVAETTCASNTLGACIFKAEKMA